MAARTATGWATPEASAPAQGRGGQLAGLALLALAAILAAALIGFDSRDPSFNNATDGPVLNPLGRLGATTADLLYQLFGIAAWLLPVAFTSWGLRLATRKALTWSWLPVLALPLALLALSGFLGSLPHPASWPIPTGLGGLVGLMLWDKVELEIGPVLYVFLALVSASALSLVAIGARWHESAWAAGRVVAGSLWLGRHVGRAAVWSGSAVAERYRAARAEAPEEPATRPRQSLRQLVGNGLQRLRGLATPEPDLEPELVDLAPPADLPRVRMRRPGPARTPLDDEPTPPAPRSPPPRPVAPRPEPPPVQAAAATPRPMPPPAKQEEPEFDAADDLHDGAYELPGLDLLAPVRHMAQPTLSKEMLHETSRQLETVLDDFGVRGQIVDAKPGPVVTLYELEPAPGTRAARVISLADDIARSLCALSVRVAVVPGRNVIGIELPNERRATVYLRELLESDVFTGSGARLPLALGKDISGTSIVVDLARMPHLLIAGTTGSGKSVAINAMILSLLYRLRPDELRVIMIDPKVIELSVYEDIPHLLAPVVTEPHKAVVALKWVVRQMDERYRLMSHLGVRDIFAFNRRIAHARSTGEELKRRVRTGFEPGTGVPIFEDQPIENRPLPLIVVIVDEVADLMLTAGKEIENAIQRLSQKARAAGIHLIVATQRPSVDVLTGVIKANLPSRISFRVSSKIDSRTILGEPGAEQLLGQGDMLHLMPGDRISRIHGPLVTDAEVERAVRHLKAQGEPDYVEDVTTEGGDEGGGSESAGGGGAGLLDGPGGGDALYQQAVQVVLKDGKASTSYLQRKLAIGYNSAAKLIERMENEGLISHADHVGRRQVLMGRGGIDGTEPTERY
jgi:S-DNA-T family DNA segregation ATPase FtsK/SpoIIIE